MPYFRASPLKTPGNQVQSQALPTAVASQEFRMQEKGNSEGKRKDGGGGCRREVAGFKEEGAEREEKEKEKKRQGSHRREQIYLGTEALCC